MSRKESPTITETPVPAVRVKDYMSAAGAKLYAIVQTAGLDCSGPDKGLRRMEEIDAQVAEVDAVQVRTRREMASARTALTEAEATAGAMAQAVEALRRVAPRPPELNDIAAALGPLARRCDEARVLAQRRLHVLEADFRRGGARLLALSGARGKVAIEANAALVAVAVTYARRLGQEDAGIFRLDPFIVSEPSHAPDSIREHHAEVQRMDALAGQIGHAHKVERAYLAAASPYDAVLLEAVAPGSRPMGIASRRRSEDVMSAIL